MLKFAFLLDVQTGNVVNAKPEKKKRKLEKALDVVRQSCIDNSLIPFQRIEPIKVNSSTNIYGQVNEKLILIAVFADPNYGSTR